MRTTKHKLKRHLLIEQENKSREKDQELPKQKHHTTMGNLCLRGNGLEKDRRRVVLVEYPGHGFKSLMQCLNLGGDIQTTYPMYGMQVRHVHAVARTSEYFLLAESADERPRSVV